MDKPQPNTEMSTMTKSKLLSIVALAASMCLLLAACGTSSEAVSKSEPKITIGYFSGGVGSPETIIGSDPSLASTVKARLSFKPITDGLDALSEMRAGAFDLVSEVGNPPVVSAVAGGTKLRVIWVQSYDGAGLIVHKGITSASQLKGATIGDLEGSSEDFELRGYLKEQGLTHSVTVLGFSSDAAAGAAWLAGKIKAAYVTIDIELELEKHGGHQLTTAEAIAKAGYPSLNVLVAEDSLIAKYPGAVQSYVCAELKATKILTTAPKSERTQRIRAAAKLQGVPPSAAVQATEQWPNIPVSQELRWFGPKASSSASPIVKAYELTASFLKSEGVLRSPPSDAVLSGLPDPTFARAAVAGKC